MSTHVVCIVEGLERVRPQGLMILTSSSLNTSSSLSSSVKSGILLSTCEIAHWYGLDHGNFGEDPESWSSLTSSDSSSSSSSSNSWS